VTDIDDDDDKIKRAARSRFLREKDMWLKEVFADRKLKSTDKNIAWAISSFLSADKRQAWPSHKRLAQMSGVGIRTSEYATRNLETAGYLTVSRKVNCSNRYEMTLPHARAVPHAHAVVDDDWDAPVPHVHAVGTAQACGVVPHATAHEPTTEPTTEPFSSGAPPSASPTEKVNLEGKEGVAEEGPFSPTNRGPEKFSMDAFRAEMEARRAAANG
jgi:DNA-binding transcriptional MocR family regulator